MTKAFHSKAQGRPELREGHTLGFEFTISFTRKGLNIVESLCNAFGVTNRRVLLTQRAPQSRRPWALEFNRFAIFLFLNYSNQSTIPLSSNY